MNLKNTLIVCSIMLATAVFLKYISHSEDIHPNKPLTTFPTEIGEWKGKVNYFDDDVYTVLGVDDSILVNYRNDDGRNIQLYIGFYQSQREGDLIHSPKNCMPGGGWNITNVEVEEVNVPELDPASKKLIRLDLENGPHKQKVLYWYHSRGRIINSEYWQKIYLVVDSITKQRTDGSFVRLITNASDTGDDIALQELKEFAKLIFPIINKYLPS